MKCKIWSQSRIARILAAPTAAMALVVASPGVAMAAQPESKSATSEACWLNVDSGETQCFDDQADLSAAVRAQTGTTLVYPSAVPRQSKGAATTDVSVAATYVLAIFYDGYNYSLNSFTATTTQSSLCSNGWSYGYSNLGNWLTGWEDRISSFKTYGGCRAQLWEERNYIGSSYGPSTGAGTMGAMHNKASSIRIFD